MTRIHDRTKDIILKGYNNAENFTVHTKYQKAFMAQTTHGLTNYVYVRFANG